jgi:ribose-phosphate pyrophosphokinase
MRITVGNAQIVYDKRIFSGGEVHVALQAGPINSDLTPRIYANVRSSNDVMELLLVTEALKAYVPGKQIELTLPYFPYARQDRRMNPGEALSVKVMADLINLQQYSQVTVWDPHSDVTAALVNNIKVIPQKDFVRRLFSPKLTPVGGVAGPAPIWLKPEQTVLVSPDAGALKKTGESAISLGIEQLVRADKIRNTKTGEITGTVAYTDHVGDKNFLILDDILDGGRTFIELAKALRPKTSGKIYLYVTHGIFSSGFDTLLDHIDGIFVANMFPSTWPARIVQI